MQVLYARCAGADVHKKTVVVCVWITGSDGKASKETRSFGTMTADILSLSDWLKSQAVTHVAMESTGVFWKPIYNLLEGQFELWVVNAHHVKAVPGRKTDVLDAEWIGDLLRHGLLRRSFVPPQPQRELRELTRHRSNIVGRRAQAVNELHKALEGTNIKLTSVATDITGVSAKAMLYGLLAGQTDRALLADLAEGRMRSKLVELEKALEGVVRPHHKVILAQLLSDIDLYDEQIRHVSGVIAERVKEDQEIIDRLDDITGVNQRVGEVIAAEVGTDMSRFPTEFHLVSWAGLCPGNNESAGKRKSTRIRPGNRHLKDALIQAAQAASRSKDTYLASLFHRLAPRRGKRKAIVAVARTILVTAYYMILRGTRYQDLGGDYFERRDPEGLARRLARRIEHLGFEVTLRPLLATA